MILEPFMKNVLIQLMPASYIIYSICKQQGSTSIYTNNDTQQTCSMGMKLSCETGPASKYTYSSYSVSRNGEWQQIAIL